MSNTVLYLLLSHLHTNKKVSVSIYQVAYVTVVYVALTYIKLKNQALTIPTYEMREKF